YHPATLVKDAQRHGVKFLPIDVNKSSWLCALEPMFSSSDDCLSPPLPRPSSVDGRKPGEIDLRHAGRDANRVREQAHTTSPIALRLVLKYVNGLREDVGNRILAARAQRPFASLADFTARVAPNRRELEVLSFSGAFATFGMNRREALWQVAALERDPRSL